MSAILDADDVRIKLQFIVLFPVLEASGSLFQSEFNNFTTIKLPFDSKQVSPMQTETTITLNNETITNAPKKQWATPAIEKMETKLEKVGGSPDLVPPDDFES